MKKQLFALSLTVFLVGCVRNNQQREVTYAEFLYQTNGKETIQVPDTAKVTQTIKVKTINVQNSSANDKVVLELYLKFNKELDLGMVMDGLQRIEGVKSIENVG